jgi:hypothetical protein
MQSLLTKTGKVIGSRLLRKSGQLLADSSINIDINDHMEKECRGHRIISGKLLKTQTRKNKFLGWKENFIFRVGKLSKMAIFIYEPCKEKRVWSIHRQKRNQ